MLLGLEMLLITGVGFSLMNATAFIGESNTMPSLSRFKTGQIRFLPGYYQQAFDANRKYLKELDSDMLLYSYRFSAYLRTPGTPCGGWETPLNPNKGSFLGHYLSACAQTIAISNDQELKAKADAIVDELAKIQEIHGGWVQATGPERFLTMEGAFKGDDDFAVITAPFYVVHKTLAGLMDMYELTGNKKALAVAIRFADWVKTRIDTWSEEKLQKILEREHGGVEESYFQLAQITGDKKYGAIGTRLEHHAVIDPLADRKDNLAGLHANTQLPKYLGEARRYEVTGEERSRKLVEFVWDTIDKTHAYCTGGSNNKEFWREPNALKGTLCNETQESCTTYNWLKLTRHLFEWTGDIKYGHMMERALVNGILPADNPKNGMFTYFLPLTTGGSKKSWGTPTDSFWCCYGTMVESLSTLVDNAYFQTKESLLVNLYIPTEVTWNDVQVSQSTLTPDNATIKINVKASKTFELVLRIPEWADAEKSRVSINGAASSQHPIPGQYYKIKRTWHDGDEVQVSFPMHFAVKPINDDPDLVALTYGPYVMAGLTDKEVTILGSAKEIGKSVTQVGPMDFNVTTSVGTTRFIPIYRIIDETYGVYFPLKAAK
jgi:DUF1680 family protein